MIAVSAVFEANGRHATEWIIFTMRSDGSDKRVLLRTEGADWVEGKGAPLPASFDVFEWEEIPTASAAETDRNQS